MSPLLAILGRAQSAPDLIVFVVSAFIVLSGAVGVIMARNPVHSALMLVMTLFGIAVLFVEQGAHFLAVVQVIVYAGAIVILFLFVIMLLGVDREEAIEADPLRAQRPVAIVLGVLALLELLALSRVTWITGTVQQASDRAANAEGSNVEHLARLIFTSYLWPFEITSVLLIIAVVGAVVLARRPPRIAAPNIDPSADREGTP